MSVLGGSHPSKKCFLASLVFRGGFPNTTHQKLNFLSGDLTAQLSCQAAADLARLQLATGQKPCIETDGFGTWGGGRRV